MTIAYFDCFSGISGNMTLGAFISLGVPVDWLKDRISGLPLSDFSINVKDVKRSGIGAKLVEIDFKKDSSSRHYSDIRGLLENCDLPPAVKKNSLETFDKIADAESKIHQCDKEKIHFHEVGSVDAIVDIVGSAICLDYFGIDQVVSSALPLGTGFVKCDHGIIPVPAPATLEILKGIPVKGTDTDCEIVTPTGAAIITTFASSFGTLPNMTCERIGYGAGTRNLGAKPNLLRVILGKGNKDTITTEEDIVVINANVDDMNPEIYGYLMERLFEDGAMDVCWIPVQMKKNRPGTMIQLLCHENEKETLIHRILSESTTIGVRYHTARRKILPREDVTVDTSYGKIRMKCITVPDGANRLSPEYEQCRNIALESGQPIRVVYDKILKETSNPEK